MAVCALAVALVACSGTPAPGAGTLALEPAALAFRGTSSHTVDVVADGAWSAEASSPWLRVTPSSGVGNATITITVDRTGLAPDHYAGTVLFRGAVAREALAVSMRFPTLSGTLTTVAGQITAQSAPSTASAASAAVDPFAFEHRAGELLVTLDPYVVAIESMGDDAPQRLDIERAVAELVPAALLRSAHALARAYGLERVRAISAESTTFVMGGPDARGALERLRRDGRTLDVHPNYIARTQRVPNDPLYAGQSWHYGMIGLPNAWDLLVGSHEVTVAVIDSAVNVGHVDLANRIVDGYDFRTSTRAITTVPDLHGTHVAGTVGARGNDGVGVTGVNWDARIMPLNVFAPNGDATFDDIIRAIYFAAGACVQTSSGAIACSGAPPVDVVNLSLGIINTNCFAMPKFIALEEATAFALGRGSTLVAAAGNDGCNVVSLPAAIGDVLAVGALTISTTRASYSNTGPELFLAAPGGSATGFVSSLAAASTEYALLAGTSMASPHVAGVVALMRAANPDLTPGEIWMMLAATAQDLGLPGRDSVFGYGLLRADSAVAAARAGLTAPASSMLVRLRSGGTVVASTRARADGSFALEGVPSGNYTLEAGNDRRLDGSLGDPGEFYGSASVTVTYSGDLQRTLTMSAR
jgi:subtilisin family serine protease